MGRLQGNEHPSRALKRHAMNTRTHRRQALELLHGPSKNLCRYRCRTNGVDNIG
jgi:hypothetical protein